MPTGWTLPSALTNLLDEPDIENESGFDNMDPPEIKRRVNRQSTEVSSPKQASR